MTDVDLSLRTSRSLGPKLRQSLDAHRLRAAASTPLRTGMLGAWVWCWSSVRKRDLWAAQTLRLCCDTTDTSMSFYAANYMFNRSNFYQNRQRWTLPFQSHLQWQELGSQCTWRSGHGLKVGVSVFSNLDLSFTPMVLIIFNLSLTRQALTTWAWSGLTHDFESKYFLCAWVANFGWKLNHRLRLSDQHPPAHRLIGTFTQPGCSWDPKAFSNRWTGLVLWHLCRVVASYPARYQLVSNTASRNYWLKHFCFRNMCADTLWVVKITISQWSLRIFPVMVR